MAQWLGQYSGHTHATKVEDAVALLRHAVEVLRATNPGPEETKKRKAVVRLAGQLFDARLKLVKARLAAANDAQSGAALADRSGEIASLERSLAAIRGEGVDSILREFGVQAGPTA